MLIIDGHLDMAYNALFHRRDLTRSIQELREREDPVRCNLSSHPDSLERRGGSPHTLYKGIATVSLPEMRRAEVGIMLTTIMARVQTPSLTAHNACRTRHTAEARGRAHLAYYKALERRGEVTFIKSKDDLERSVTAWQDPQPDTPIGLILSMESADPISSPEAVAEWWEAGLRSVTLTHFGANTYGHGTGSLGGLYPTAYPLLDAMRETDMIIDLTHASDQAFWQILDYWDGPVHASHCNCRALVEGQRLLSDDMLRAIIERDGVIGIVFVDTMVNPQVNWDDPSTFVSQAARPMRAMIEHVDHICQLAGNGRHVAIGTDLDGGFGRELAPVDMDTIADLQGFLDLLRGAGYNEDDVAAIAHGNLLRLFRNNWQ
mgnify:CR=1 FL=1